MSPLKLKIPDSLSGVLPDFLKDSDNLLVLALLFMLMKEKANPTLVIALISIIMQETPQMQEAQEVQDNAALL